jgi:hypothetical protein
MKNREIYAELGLLSIQFAEIEQIVKDILVKYICRDCFADLIGILVTEDFSLEKRLKLLKEINKYSDEYEEKISNLISLIKPKQTLRNDFIHGIWHIRNDEYGRINIVVEKKKIIYKETPIPIKNVNEKNELKKRVQKTWRHSKFEFYTINDLELINQELLKIISKGKDILNEIDEKGFD